VPKRQAALVYLITAHHLYAFLLYLARWLCGGFKQKQKKPSPCSLFKKDCWARGSAAVFPAKFRVV